jgi:radical SAM protein with 4Fe4S-binding SPASM domain
MGGKQLCISGGEPLSYPELESVLKLCVKERIETSIYTTGITNGNGHLHIISDKILELLDETKTKAIISIHGAQKSTHEMVTTVEDSFHLTTRAIEKLVYRGIQIQLHVVPMVINYSELVGIARFAVENGIYQVSWLRFVPQGRGALNKHLLNLSSEQLSRLTAIKDDINALIPTVKIRTGSPFNILCSDSPTPCKAAVTLLTVNPDGTVSPCDAFKRFKIIDAFGSILNQSLPQVWERSVVLNSVRRTLEGNNISTCLKCRLYPSCQSGCLAQKAIEAGEITSGRDPDCPAILSAMVRDESEAIAV